MRCTILLSLVLLLASCTNVGSQESGSTTGTGKQAVDERDLAMKPEELIGVMGQDLTGLTVADLFAEDGYFTFKLIAAGANVIAVVNDAGQAERLKERKRELGLGDDRLLVRAVPVGDPGLTANEADMALMVHHFVGMRDREAYFKQLRNGLRHPRPLYIVEYKYAASSSGPPITERMRSEEVMDLIGLTGYAEVGAHADKVPDHVVYVINDIFDPNIPIGE